MSKQTTKNANQQLLYVLRDQQTFIENQSRLLILAQQQIEGLQSAQQKVENERVNLLQELQQAKAMELENQTLMQNLTKEVEAIKVMIP